MQAAEAAQEVSRDRETQALAACDVVAEIDNAHNSIEARVPLSLLGGAVLLVDLRMLGLGLKKQPISEISGYVRPWLIVAIVILLATGIPLFLSEAIKCFYNTSFWVKMTTLPIALLFTFLVRERVARNAKLETSMKIRGVAIVSIALWLTVAAAGRWIGFS